jgi:hypothetical protein
VSGPSLRVCVWSATMRISSRARASQRPACSAGAHWRASASDGLARRVAAAALMALAVASAGCSDRSRSFLASERLRGELQEDYRERIVVVRTPNGDLQLTAEPLTPEEQKVRPGIDRVRALRIAKFARAHYADTAGLREITVILPSKTVVPTRQRHVYSGATWRITALDSLPDPDATSASADVQE